MSATDRVLRHVQPSLVVSAILIVSLDSIVSRGGRTVVYTADGHLHLPISLVGHRSKNHVQQISAVWLQPFVKLQIPNRIFYVSFFVQTIVFYLF